MKILVITRMDFTYLGYTTYNHITSLWVVSAQITLLNFNVHTTSHSTPLSMRAYTTLRPLLKTCTDVTMRRMSSELAEVLVYELSF